MNVRIVPGDYRRGLVLAVPVRTSVGVVRHKGILGDLRGPDGLPTVIHASKHFENRVIESSMTDYASHSVGAIEPDGYPGDLPPEAVLDRARSALGSPWKLTRNCEHFVTWAHGLDPESPQLRTGILKAGVVGVASAGLFAASVLALRRARSLR